MLNDVHCHFFSEPFFNALGGETAIHSLGWDPPGTADALADRWVAELDRAGVSRAALIASIPGDMASVGAAVKRHRRSRTASCSHDTSASLPLVRHMRPPLTDPSHPHVCLVV